MRPLLKYCNPTQYRIIWSPVVFAFSFTKKELQTQPLATLRQRFEHLDIKLVTDYVDSTTHVVSKKRNTAKGLQALINGRFIVNETFLDAVSQAAEPIENEGLIGSSLLEQDFGHNWPDAMQHLPPRGGEPVQHPDSIYTPDTGRSEIFEGYTFIFYDEAQFSNLQTPISSGGGKALLRDVVPEETQVGDFVQYVKSVAGEKGLGAFDDGSEGKGVVLVRYLPSKGHLIDWYTRFLTSVSLLLDHRPIEQSEFLEAILIKDASILRRPLEVESTPNTQVVSISGPQEPATQAGREDASTPVEELQPPPRRANTRRPVKRRFVGFDEDVDIDMDDIPPAPAAASNPTPEDEGGLFVSQEQDPSPELESMHTTRLSQRKRPASTLQEDDLMEGMAPAAAKFKRQRLERGEEPDALGQEADKAAETRIFKPEKKLKKEIDVLAMVTQHREEEEARARAEKEDLANLPDDIDLAEIRRLNIVEEIEVHLPSAQARTRDQDVADGRWDPKWNGMKNFKKFRRRGEPRGRQPARVIVSLTEAKNKEFGVGDDYWLEDESQGRKKATSQTARESEASSAAAPESLAAQRRRVVGVVVEDSSDEEQVDTPEQPESAASRTRTSQVAATPSQASARTQVSRDTTKSQGSKRSAPESAPEQPAKRQRPTRKAPAASDDSDDELKFRFGKRR